MKKVTNKFCRLVKCAYICKINKIYGKFRKRS